MSGKEKRIGSDFSKSAQKYDEYAALQHNIAASCCKVLENYLLGKYKNTNLIKRHTIIDVGCGTGYAARHFGENHNLNILQMDIAENMLIKASETGNLAIAGSATNMPFCDNIADIIYSSLCLQWVEDINQSFKEFRRCLKNEGYIIFSTLTKGSLYELERSFASADNEERVLQFKTAEYYVKALENKGFRILHNYNRKIVEHHESPLKLMKNLKEIGANYKESKHITPGLMKKTNEYYIANFSTAKNNIRASYQILYIIAKKL